jgi:hypothetical protein
VVLRGRLETPINGDFSQPRKLTRQSREKGKPRYFKACSVIGQRDFAAAVLLPQRQSAVVVLTAHVELLGITVISGLRGVGALYCT